MTSKRILIVDDDEMIVNLCLRVLRKEGYEAASAFNGEQAIILASSETFHMAVTDMLMPGMNGLETFHALREKQSELIGILITGHGTIDTAIQAMGKGLIGFIRKPFLPQELVMVVKDAFNRAGIAEENTRLKSLLPLYELGEKFILSRSREEIFDGLIETLSLQTGAQRFSVMLWEEKENSLKIVASRGIKKEIAEKVRIKPGEKVAGRVFISGKPLIINGGSENNPQMEYLLNPTDIVASMSFPLKTRDKILGVLNISKVKKGASFSESDIEMVSIICRQAVMALENLKAIDEKAEKIRTRTLLEQYLAPEVAEKLMASGENLLEVGEIKSVSILFADIRNFTPLVQQMPLEAIRSFLNDFFGLFSEVIFKFKGTMDKFLGDAVLAFFGAPVPIPDPEILAVDSAIMVHKAFKELKESWAMENEALNQIGLGIGISSGEVFLGNVGSKRRLDYTVIGTDVNIAQRLSSKAVAGEILVTERVRSLIGSRFSIIKESSLLLKGLEMPVPVFSIAVE